jgi:hypothetical protein
MFLSPRKKIAIVIIKQSLSKISPAIQKYLARRFTRRVFFQINTLEHFILMKSMEKRLQADAHSPYI